MSSKLCEVTIGNSTAPTENEAARVSDCPGRKATSLTYPPTSSSSSRQNSSSLYHEKLNLRFAGAFCALFTAGWADGVTGTILPHIKSDFQLTYMLSSLLFITSTAGFALGVILIEKLMSIIGCTSLQQAFQKMRHPQCRDAHAKQRQNNGSTCGGCDVNRGSKARARFRILVLGAGLHASFFVLMGTASGFPNVLIAYFLASLGKAFLNGTLNAYIAASPKRPLGQLYACNALGALFGPLVCQSLLAQSIPWQHFYLGSLVLPAINVTLLGCSFWPTQEESSEADSCEVLNDSTQHRALRDTRCSGSGPLSADVKGKAMDMSSVERGSIRPDSSHKPQKSTLAYALRLRYVWAFSFFMWIYSGSETSTQGYMATYLLAVRNADPKAVGYVSSGFWGGMAISRLATGLASPYLTFTQRKHAIHIILALSMHLTIWFINSVFENACSTAVIGLLYGPVYPTILSLSVDLLPREAHMITMAIISGFANLGSSIFPFLAGAMSNIRGPKVLVYMTVAQTVTLIALWTLFPTKTRN